MCMLNQYLPIITLYNKQNFVQQFFALQAVKSGYEPPGFSDLETALWTIMVQVRLIFEKLDLPGFENHLKKPYDPTEVETPYIRFYQFIQDY